MEKGELAAALRAEFDDRLVKWDEDNRPYIPPEQIEQRLDEVVGPTGWSWEVTQILWMTPEGRVMDPNVGATEPAHWVMARGRLKIRIDGQETYRDGEGGARIMRHRNEAKSHLVVDPGDNLKGACSNAFKKAALRFGIGAYLRDDSVKRRVLASQQEGQRTERAARGGQGERSSKPGGRTPEQGAPAPQSPAGATEGKQLRVRLVQNPVRPAGTGRCEALVEDGKGNRATLRVSRRDLVALLAETKVGTVLTVLGLIVQGESGPMFEASEIAPPEPPQKPAADPRAGQAGTQGNGGRELTVTLVSALVREADGKTGRAVVANADGVKAVLVTSKPSQTALVAAQKIGTHMVIFGEVQREGSEVRLLPQSIRPQAHPVAS